jgi:nitroreductase
MNEGLNIILNRRSIRAYKQEQIKEEELQTIIEAGKFAPSANNEQCWHFTIIQNKDILIRINNACREIMMKSPNKMFAERAKSEDFSVFYNAPTLFIISADEKAVAPQVDSALAMQNAFLAAEALGIGSCWIHAVVNFLNSEAGKALKQELQIPEGFTVYASSAFGYKAMEASPAPRKEGTVTIIS